MQADRERLFFALWPDDPVRERLAMVESELPSRHGKWVHPEDRHITLVFLGDVDPDQRPCIEQAADRVHGTPFHLEIDQIGYWRRPRILGCGPTHPPESLQRLVDDLQRELSICGFRPETRPYSPHITLARKARQVRFRWLDEPLPWPVREFVLVASQLGGEPPRYRVLRRWPLG